jgi:hypothetical protein
MCGGACIRVHAHERVHVHVCIFVSAYVCACTCACVCTCVRVCVWVCVCVCLHAWDPYFTTDYYHIWHLSTNQIFRGLTFW